VENAQARPAERIKSQGGHVTQYTLDGFKSESGDPIARKDDPEQTQQVGKKLNPLLLS
jgi:hypothetical protein